jgi:adenosylcobinamide-phosphate synthase
VEGAAQVVAVLAGALVADLAFGEPPADVHPVVWMGRATTSAMRFAPANGRVGPLLFGGLVALGLPTIFAVASAGALRAARLVPGVELVVAVLVLKSTFAVRALGAAGFAVRRALARGDLPGARAALRSLCSRDAATLDEPALIAATVESLAENASDSVIAPLLYFAVAGVPGAVFYRAANTLDAMIGYHGKYELLGKAAARLDDLLNLVPARLTAALFLVAGATAGCDARAALRVLRRDARLTESPNAGRPMAVMAGLLQVELAKTGAYRLGDPIRPLTLGCIDAAWRIAGIAFGFAAAGAAAIALGHGSRG